MHPTVYKRLVKNKKLLRYVRENPSWYRYLSREPNLIENLEEEVKRKSRRELPNKIDNIHKNFNLIKLLLKMMHNENKS